MYICICMYKTERKGERETEIERRRGWVGPIRLIPRRRPQPKERNKKE